MSKLSELGKRIGVSPLSTNWCPSPHLLSCSAYLALLVWQHRENGLSTLSDGFGAYVELLGLLALLFREQSHGETRAPHRADLRPHPAKCGGAEEPGSHIEL